MPPVSISADSDGALEQAVAALKSGGLLAFPTDTVYGLAADLEQASAIEGLYRVKGRQSAKPIPILLPDLESLTLVSTGAPEPLLRLAESLWPGPLTIVVPRRSDLPAAISSTATIGVRVPDHPLALALLRAAGPLAVTSANRSGQPACTEASQVLEQIGDDIDFVLDGGVTPGGKASTVVTMLQGDKIQVLREGPISRGELQRALA